MATPIHAPRINNNDDEVKVLAFDVAQGALVQSGQILGQIETDKAVLDVESPADGYVLGFLAKPDDMVKVGSILLWLGEQPDEPFPADSEKPITGRSREAGTMTAKARLLLSKYRLNPEDIPLIDGRITVASIEKYLAAGRSLRTTTSQDISTAHDAESVPQTPGLAVDLSREEKGMANAVLWHRDHAVTGYIEIDYDLAPWAEYAKRMQDEKGWMMSPLLPLMAWRLVQAASANPRLNATLIDGKRFEYMPVNLGFTIQAGETLYLAVLRDSAKQDEHGFVAALGDLQRRAAGHKLRESETSGATLGFSSMVRWQVTRHIPILPRQTSFMVAHAAGRNGKGILGATYDHRVLTGAQVVNTLRQISRPKTN
ncbi:MAG: 2-oxo acid dehydrogenase subunit E2 [Candidatus Accumulibacter sp.]|uniref:2-oxo acid dehydrogenase subunit E2 n=1 Tax=Accumulibacter sp. TaxID=2053492 RepID=UPI00258E54AD|nr:2-oxo acid dehydrogenase subunit E2 [Accumulibacter sp.]MCM8621357.1 2-oxo acid dehydrogenase subunit E2 [Accumulibacter sp.]